MVGQRFQVQHLRALQCQFAQQAALARAGLAADHAVAEALRKFFKRGHHGTPELGVAPFEQMNFEADLIQHQGQRAAAFAAAPAVDQRLPVLARLDQFALDVVGDVAYHQGRAALLGGEGRLPFVVGAHQRPLVIGQAGPVDRAGQPVERELALRAGVDEGVEFVQPCQRLGGGDGHKHER